MSKEAKLKFKAGSFDIIEHGDHVLCSVSGKKSFLSDLMYCNVELQEAYYSSEEVAKKFLNE